MNEPIDRTALRARIDAVEQRLNSHSAKAPPAGLTEPDADGSERWEAGQVWAHMAEFVHYWLAELHKVVADFQGTPVPFGRTKADPTRAAAIETGRHVAIATLMGRVGDGLASLTHFLDGLTEDQWAAVGLHSRLGEMHTAAIVQRFLVSHLEEHADQLDGLG